MAAYPSERLKEIWERHEREWSRLDELEARLDESMMQKRRRLANILDQTPTHRRSTLRLFVTHDLVENEKYTLVIEGRLLVGHLDHQSANRVEQEAAEAAGVTQSTVEASNTTTTNSSSNAQMSNLPSATTLQQQQQQQQTVVRSTDRTQYRGISEKEGDVPVTPIRFTHFFDKLTVDFAPIYEPVGGTAGPSTPVKKSRSKFKREAAELARKQKMLTQGTTTRVEWTRQLSTDADAFRIAYNQLPPPNGKAFHSIVATIRLQTHPGPEAHYQVSTELGTALFPEHLTEEQMETKSSKKRKRNEEGKKDIAMENHINVPPSLTMKEIVSAFFIYVREKNLVDESDKSIIVNDKILAKLFDCERMSFFELQQRLLNRRLITKLQHPEPMILTYILTPDTTADTSNMLSFDTDIYVEGLFHYRVRELMRRIKRREFEYTSSRTKARNILMASRNHEPLVKTAIEQAVVGKGCWTVESVPVWNALAKAAPAYSEARAAAQLDAQTSVLMDRLLHHTNAAKAAWDIVEACRQEEDEEEG